MADKHGKCDFCENAAIENLDGDELCQRHADMWLRAEEDDRRRYEEENELGRDA